jgi:hypothetical protein
MKPKVIEQIEQGEAERKRQARVTYLEILNRADTPKKGDAEKLQAAMAELGYASTRLESDLNVIREAAALEQQAIDADNAELKKEIEAAGESWKAFCEETKRFARSREEEETRRFDLFREMARRRDTAKAAARRHAELLRQNWDLFGGPEPEPEAPSPGAGLIDAADYPAMLAGGTVTRPGPLTPSLFTPDPNRVSVPPTENWPNAPAGTSQGDGKR